MANDEQQEHWDGEGGEHWVAEQARYDRLLERFGEQLVAALAPAPGERVVDIGCGTGAVSRAVAQRVGPGGEVQGVDLSGPMLARGRETATEAGLDNVRFEQADASTHDFVDTADALTSRFGVMFFDDPPAAFRNLATALRPGGRLAFVCWQELFTNEWLTVPAGVLMQHVPPPDLGGLAADDDDPSRSPAPGPFALADADRTRALLTGAGLIDVDIAPLHEPMWMGETGADAVSFLSRTEMSKLFLSDVDAETTKRAWDAVTDALDERATSEGVVLSGDAWVVTANKPDR